MLKNQNIRILLKLTWYQRASHFGSNSANETQIWAHMQKLEQVKFHIWLTYMAELDDMENPLNEWGGTKWQGSFGPRILQITKDKQKGVTKSDPSREWMWGDKSQSQIGEGNNTIESALQVPGCNVILNWKS